MKCTIPEISWHNKEPVLSVDIQQVEQVDTRFYRLASGGSDNHVLIWQLKIQDNGAAAIELLADLTRHQRSVNVVRWSPSGQYLATADDDANIIIWTLKVDNIPSLEGEDDNKESWIVYKVLRGHKEDIYDMCWSPDGLKILTGSIDNTAIVWDVTKGKNEHIITDHKSFVQGVAWNPTHQPPYMATLSSDRTCRILDSSSPRYQIRYRIARSTLPLPSNHPLSSAVNPEAEGVDAIMPGVKLFHDDTFRTYFRRLAFTPDGSLLLVPSGCVDLGDGQKGDGDGKVQERNVLYGTYIFATMGSFNSPLAILVSPRQCTIAVRCCPILFELRSNGPDPYIQLPYRMIFAIATDSDVVLYDTQQTAPFAHLQNIHYTRLTDLTWSLDGRILTAASTDGFCTIVTFEPDELGKVYVKEESETEESVLNISSEVLEVAMEVELEKDVNIPILVEKEAKKKKPSFLEQWTKMSKKCTKTDVVSITENSNENNEKHLKVRNDPVIKARMALFENEQDKITTYVSKNNKINFDCEIIDLSDSLSQESGNLKKRITPILLSSVKKYTNDSDIKSPRRIAPTLINSESQRNNDSIKRRITPTLISKRVNNAETLKPRLFDTEVIDLVANKDNVSIEKKATKRSISPSVTLKSKSPPSAKKLKTNTLLNFIQRGPKMVKNQDSSKPISTAINEPSRTNSSETIIKASVVVSEKLVDVLAEESARDAWKCDQIENSDVTEDIPDDFKLQLEETTSTNMEQSKSETEINTLCSEDGVLFVNDKPMELRNAEVTCEKNVQDEDKAHCPIDSVKEENCSNTNTAEQKLVTIEKENSGESKVEDKAPAIAQIEMGAAVKRRVPLITLSSPKNKKKPSAL